MVIMGMNKFVGESRGERAFGFEEIAAQGHSVRVRKRASGCCESMCIVKTSQHSATNSTIDRPVCRWHFKIAPQVLRRVAYRRLDTEFVDCSQPCKHLRNARLIDGFVHSGLAFV